MQYPDNLPEITDITDRFLTEDERQSARIILIVYEKADNLYKIVNNLE
jgi:hypothetical protein